MHPVKLTLALANYGVALLNAIDAIATMTPKDWLAVLAWLGSGTYWLWQAGRDGN